MGCGGKENLVQAAITAALEVYCSVPGRPQLRQFPPFANQQGNRMRQYCGDIVGMLNDGQALLLEIKERDCVANVLWEFDQEQFSDNVALQELGVPIAYAYNLVPQLEYHCLPRKMRWPEVTLGQVKRTVPKQLPGQRPAVDSHESLLEWLSRQEGEDATANFGRIHGALQGPGDLRNGILVLLYGVSENAIAALTPNELNQVVDWLSNNSRLHPEQMHKLQIMLGESAAVFHSFALARPAPTVPPPPDSSVSYATVTGVGGIYAAAARANQTRHTNSVRLTS